MEQDAMKEFESVVNGIIVQGKTWKIFCPTMVLRTRA